MMLALLLSVTVSAAPVSPRLVYEQRCLYCHSSELSERSTLTPIQWRAMVESMRVKAPLLITRSDARVITAYIIETLKLVPKAAAPVVARSSTPRPATPAKPIAVTTPLPTGPAAASPVAPPEPVTVPEPLPVVAIAPEDPPMRPEDELAEQEGAEVMQRRCSKCHTLNRVFSKLDTFERSMATVRRMRMKTGSGITAADLAQIERFLRLDLKRPASKTDDES